MNGTLRVSKVVSLARNIDVPGIGASHRYELRRSASGRDSPQAHRAGSTRGKDETGAVRGPGQVADLGVIKRDSARFPSNRRNHMDVFDGRTGGAEKCQLRSIGREDRTLVADVAGWRSR